MLLCNQGAFGVVVKGRLVNEAGISVACACKTLKDVKNKTGLDELVAEVRFNSTFGPFLPYFSRISTSFSILSPHISYDVPDLVPC